MEHTHTTILIVDDEPNIRETVRYILDMEGYRPVTAANGDEALALARELHPPVMLLDVMMPKRDGYDVCRTLKQDPEFADIFVIMLTARGQNVDEERGRAAGADAYVTKPFEDDHILDMIHTALTAQTAAA